MHAGAVEDLATRVMRTVRLSPTSLDDDELARRLDVSPRQTINQVCRKLAARGALRRVPGPYGKLVNLAISTTDRPSDDIEVAPVVQPGPPDELPPGNSAEQRAAERMMLDLLGAKLNVHLSVGHIVGPKGGRVEIDGADDARAVLVEAWAHQGPPKSAQKHKVLADALKLIWVSSRLPERPRLILLMSDEAAAKPFTTARSWAAEALRDLGVEVHVVELDEAVRERIRQAQQRQYR